jgi:hypothetical protein
MCAANLAPAMPRSVFNPRADTLRRFARVGMPEFTNEAVLAALFLASFVAATVLPAARKLRCSP